MIVELVRNFTTHPWNLNFQPVALADYINEDDGALELWDVAIPQGSQTEDTVEIDLIDRILPIVPEGRKLEWDASITNLLRVNGHHVRVGTGGCSKIGLDKDTIIQLRKDNDRITDRTYLIKDRNPLALVHILKIRLQKKIVKIMIQKFCLRLVLASRMMEKTEKLIIW